MQVVEPTFPLSQPPICLACGCPGDLVQAARRSNPIGNAGRPYYICSRGRHEADTWITFNDNIGIVSGNPPCYCRYTSRLSSRRNGDGQFYSCPVGKCRFVRNGPSLPPQTTQMQAEAGGMEMDISGSGVEIQSIIQPVSDYDMMDVD